MKKGIYESLMTKALEDILSDPALLVDREALDPADSPRFLSAYLGKRLRQALRDMADEEGAGEDQVRLVNRLLALLGAAEKEDVAAPASLLTEVREAKNTMAGGKRQAMARPDTSISHSYLFTGSRKEPSMAAELRKEAASADRIDLLVSFIRWSGLSLLLPILKDFTSRGGRLRVITTTYMGATDPKAVSALAALPGSEVRISYNVKETRLHAKSYIFYRESGFHTGYIGSSNLSHAAIVSGLEWNMKVSAQDQPEIMEKMKATFEAYWHSGDFAPYREEDRPRLEEAVRKERGGREKGSSPYLFDMHPYPFQKDILDRLEAERHLHGRWRNLVVAATGTGKTAIAAFDYRRFAASRKPGVTRLLFAAHRKEILEQARSCFRQVLKDPSFGAIAAGGEEPERLDYLFMTVQTFQSRAFWKNMDPDFYDMIIVDETHHSAASSYEELFTHFTPQILLGLTATPERMDGKSILPLFDNRIAAEIRLPDAIEKRLLSPFHYFGAADPIDLSHVAWKNGQYDTGALNKIYAIDAYSARQRGAAVLSALERYTADMNDVKGLGFCVSQAHAHFMADYMKAHGVPSMALDAKSSETDRTSARGALESGAIRLIFTVDLFNEGVDIPSVNTVLFLRPTNSLTIFLQQLGRGLRLAEGKEALTVLDFISAANRRYDYGRRFQALLSAPAASVKDEVEGYFPHVPKGCAIQLEPQSEKHVLQNIRDNLKRRSYYRDRLAELYETLGRVPALSEYLKAVDVAPEEFYTEERNYTAILAEAGIGEKKEFTKEEQLLAAVFPRAARIDSLPFLQFLQNAFNGKMTWDGERNRQYLRMWEYTYGKGEWDKLGLSSAEELFACWASHRALLKEMNSLLALLIDRVDLITEEARLPYECALDIHASYSRDQIFAALGLKSPRGVQGGVRYVREKRTDVFLVTLNKSSKEFSDSTLYEDYAIDSRLFHWQSQNRTEAASETGKRYIEQPKNGTIVLFFVRERKKDERGKAMNYTFLGEAGYVSHHGSAPITIIYRLKTPIPARFLPTAEAAGIV